MLSCHSSDDPKWYFDYTIKEPISRDNPLILNNVKSSNGGNYFCYGSYKDKKRHFLASATLEIYGKFFFHYICICCDVCDKY